MSSLFSSVLASFGVYPESCMALSLATDGLGKKARVLMMSLKSFDDEDNDINVFVAGGDVSATQRFTGITRQVYDGLAVKPEDIQGVLAAKLDQLGVTNLVCHAGLKFVKPIVRRHKLIPNRFSFVDVTLMHKALGGWTENLRQATNLIDLQAKIERMRGSNLSKLGELAEQYDVEPEITEESPYIPVRKARVVRDIFASQLEMELPF